VELVASLSQGRTAAAQCGLFTHKSVPVIFEPPCRCTSRACPNVQRDNFTTADLTKHCQAVQQMSGSGLRMETNEASIKAVLYGIWQQELSSFRVCL